MNLDELLKVNSVRCIKTKVDEDLVEGEIYKVEGFNDEAIKIVDRNGFSSWHNKNLFETILNNDMSKSNAEIDISENSVNDNINMDELVKHLAVGKNWKEVGCDHIVTITEISSEFANSTMVAFESDCCLSFSPLAMFLKDFEPVLDNDMSKSDTKIDISENSVNAVNNVIPTFKVGDKVYKYGETDVKTVLEVFEDVYMSISNYPYRVNHEAICHATQENYELLCKLYPHIEFEFPPEPLTGNELCYLMLRNKHTNIMCQVDGDKTNIRIITLYTGDYFYDRSGNRYSEVVPIDTKGIPLTEDVLNDIN